MIHHGRLRVLFVVEPGVDGVFHYLDGLARYLMRQREVEIHLAYSSVRGSTALFRLVDSLRSRGAQTLDLRVGNSPHPSDISAFARLWRLARSLRPDIVHAHSSKAGVLGRGLAMAGVRARYFYTPHAYFQMGGGGVKRRLFLMIERFFARLARTIHVSPSEAEFARRVLGLKAAQQVILENGVDVERFRPVREPSEKRSVRLRLGLPETALVLGTIARFTEQKDPLTLYRAALIAMEKIPTLHLAHVGHGDLAHAVDSLLAACSKAIRARFHRMQTLDDTAEFYRALDGFVLASRYEGLALSAIEASASNLPMILSRSPGNIDFERWGFNGLRWVAPGDAAALAEQIVAWATEVTEGSATECNHRNVTSARLDSGACYGRQLALYSDTERNGG